jgi:ATP-dependent protease HslVU (ClpYQ) peptidase subunit
MMASDSQANGGYVKYNVKKLYRTSRGIIGCTGSIFECKKFVEWFEKGEDRSHLEDIDNDFIALVLTPDGLYLYSNEGVAIELVDGAHAIGSGQETALAALRSGMSPVDAIHFAAKGDAYTGGAVQVEYM